MKRIVIIAAIAVAACGQPPQGGRAVQPGLSKVCDNGRLIYRDNNGGLAVIERAPECKKP